MINKLAGTGRYLLIADSSQSILVLIGALWAAGCYQARDVTAAEWLRLRPLPATLLTYLQTVINASSRGDVSPAPRTQVTAQKKRKTLGFSDVGQIYDVRIVPATPHDAGRHRTIPDDRCRSLTDNVNSSSSYWAQCDVELSYTTRQRVLPNGPELNDSLYQFKDKCRIAFYTDSPP